MLWTTADTIQIIGLVITFVVAIFGLLKSTAEKDKLEAETAVLYANLSADGAKRERQFKIDIETLEKHVDTLQSKISSQDKNIAELKEIIEQKDNRIYHLETLTVTQEKEIGKLRTELNALRKNIK